MNISELIERDIDLLNNFFLIYRPISSIYDLRVLAMIILG